MLTVGVAMLQGARNEHMYSLRRAAQNLDMTRRHFGSIGKCDQESRDMIDRDVSKKMEERR